MNLSLKSGSLFDNKYRIEAVLGAGAFATVYKALDIELNREIAIKSLQSWSDQPESLQRFKREAQVLCKLNHPNILRVFRFGLNESEAPFLIMEYVRGESLRELIDRSGPLSFKITVKIALKVAYALAYSHQHGIVHRDLKPENILLQSETLEAADPVIKLIDFGLCKPDSLVNTRGQSTLTGTGNLIGTALYMSPEQVMGQKVDERSDIYSFACVLFEMLTGKAPFAELSTAEVLMKRTNEDIPEILKLSPESGVPSGLDALIQDCSARQANDRLQSFDEVIQALQSISSFSDDGKYKPAEPRFLGRSSKVRLIALTGIVVLLFGIAIASIVVFQTARTPDQAMNSAFDSTQSLLKKKRSVEAKKLAKETFDSDFFKRLPEWRQSEFYYRFFELFRQAKDDQSAQVYSIKFLKSGIQANIHSKVSYPSWEKQVQEVERYLMGSDLSPSSWRSVSNATAGSAGKGFNSSKLVKVLLKELRKESLFRSWAEINKAIAADYCNDMSFLATEAGSIDRDDLVERFLKICLVNSKKYDLPMYEETAYAKLASLAFKQGKLDDAERWMKQCNETYLRIESSNDVRNLRPDQRAKELRIDQKLNEALAEEFARTGQSKVASEHRRRAESLEKTALRLERMSQTPGMRVHKMVNDALSTGRY